MPLRRSPGSGYRRLRTATSSRTGCGADRPIRARGWGCLVPCELSGVLQAAAELARFQIPCSGSVLPKAGPGKSAWLKTIEELRPELGAVAFPELPGLSDREGPRCSTPGPRKMSAVRRRPGRPVGGRREDSAARRLSATLGQVAAFVHNCSGGERLQRGGHVPGRLAPGSNGRDERRSWQIGHACCAGRCWRMGVQTSQGAVAGRWTDGWVWAALGGREGGTTTDHVPELQVPGSGRSTSRRCRGRQPVVVGPRGTRAARFDASNEGTSATSPGASVPGAFLPGRSQVARREW